MAPSGNTEKRAQVTRSLMRARAVQLGMLPDAPVMPELEIGVHYEACEELGGDFYDFIQVSPTELGIVLADVSGHGLDAALMMAAAKKTLQIHGRRNPSPAEVLTIACEDLADDLPRGSFVTVWYGVIDLKSGLMRYASAGHNPFLKRSPNGSLTSHDSKGVVLGGAFVQTMRDTLEEATLQLNRDDWLVFYTDGVSEAADHEDELFGQERLEASFAEASTGSPVEVLQALQIDVETFRAGREADDDVTLLAVRFNGSNEPEADAAWRPRIESNLPARSNTFVGREDEMMAIAAALEEGQRFITVIGVAGLGKTRLALEAARQVAADFVGGTWMISLDNCADLEAIIATIAGELQLGQLRGEPLVSLGAALALRGPSLLLLDNAETCADHLSKLLEGLKTSAPDVRCLVTSQLHIAGKDVHELEIKPLFSPGSDFRKIELDAAEDYPAVGLLVDRASSANPKFELNGDNAQSVFGICAELEGMPLAIELAASRMNQLTPAEVFRQLRTPTNKIELLRQQAGEAALPYRSMREALEWSYAHLDDWEQIAFRQMCAFRGGFYLEAAEQVVKVPDGKRARGVISAIDSLLNKSFLRRESTPYGTRFNTYSSLRDFASRLVQPGEDGQFKQRHLEYFVQYADGWNDQRQTRKVIEATERVALDADNIRAAIKSAMDIGDLKSAVRLFDALFHCRDQRGSGDIRPLLDLVWERVDELDAGDSVLITQMKALESLTQGSTAQALELATRAVKIAEDNNKIPALISSLILRGRSHGNMGREDIAATDFQRVIDVANEAGKERDAGVAKISLANIAARQFREAEAEALFKEAMEVLEREGDLRQKNVARANLTIMLLRLKRWDEAEVLLEESRAFVERTKSRDMTAMVELAHARLLEGRAQPEEAIEHYMRAFDLFQESGHGINASVTRLNMGTLCLSVGDIDAARDAATVVKQFAEVSNTLLLTMRTNTLLGLIALEDNQHEEARQIFHANEELTATRKDDALQLNNKALSALAEFNCGNFEQATNLVMEATPLVESASPPLPEVRFLVLALRARILQSQNKQANAGRFAAMAREIAEAEDYNEYSTNYFERAGVELLDVPANAAEAVHIRVRCPVCGQRYMGSEGRIRSLNKCLKCGMKPFKPLKVQSDN